MHGYSELPMIRIDAGHFLEKITMIFFFTFFHPTKNFVSLTFVKRPIIFPPFLRSSEQIFIFFLKFFVSHLFIMKNKRIVIYAFFQKRLEKGPTVGIKRRLEVVVIIYNLPAEYLIPTVNYGLFNSIRLKQTAGNDY